MDARGILGLLRSGNAPDAAQMAWFAQAIADGSVTDAQVGAFAMGVCRTPLTREARVALTLGMRDSGHVLSWDLPGPVLDKHSTGGIGDCVSLVLAPALAACGVYVPMVSGRGLGHTGGTLDKLESIPGYRTDLDDDRLRAQVTEIGCAIVSANAGIAPADKRLYAVRDVTGTVESLDLITASILSKKLAAGLDGLVLDVKVGSGAFMKDMAAARALAGSLVETACGAGCPTMALITDMSQPLVTAAGNALEVVEVMETLTATYVTQPLWELTVELGGELLALAGRTHDAEHGGAMIAESLHSGRAAEVFGRMVAAQGGPSDFVSNWRDRLPSAPAVVDVAPDLPGHVSAIDAEALGLAVISLGGGRRRETDRIDPSVGLSKIAGIGEEVGPGRPLARVHARSPLAAEEAASAVRAAFAVGDRALDPPKLIHARIAG